MEEVKKLVLKLMEINTEYIKHTELESVKSTAEFCNKTLQIVLKTIEENE